MLQDRVDASPGAEALKPIGIAATTLTVGSLKAKSIDGS
jgi:hypothetical protein